MSVFVDDVRVWKPGHPPSCHLTADTPRELAAFAERYGVPKSTPAPVAWPVPHYDLGAAWHGRAMIAGAEYMSAKRQAQRRIGLRAQVRDLLPSLTMRQVDLLAAIDARCSIAKGAQDRWELTSALYRHGLIDLAARHSLEAGREYLDLLGVRWGHWWHR